MGLFGIFKKEKKTYTINEAAEMIQKQLDEIQSKNKNQMGDTAKRIRIELKQLEQLVKEFAAKETPEFAKRSENVKERFCTIAKKQLESLQQTDAEGGIQLDPGELLRAAGDLLNNIGGLTQRQILHINVFFKTDFAPIGRKMKDIEQVLKIDSSGGDYSRAIMIHQKIASTEKRIGDLDDASSLENKIKDLNHRHGEEEKLKITEPDNLHLARIRKSLEEIKQELNSFLPVQKLLKKYAYARQLKDPMIEEYINSPTSAILLDEDLKIIGYVDEASKMFSELNENKLDAILRGRLLLNEKRKELEKIMKKELDESARYDDEKDVYDRAMSEKRGRVSAIEQEIKDVQKQLDELKEERKELENELATIRVEFCMLTGKLLGAEVS